MIGEPGLQAILLLAAAARTATGTGTAVDMRDYTGIGHLLFNCSASASGTNPTIDAKLRHSTDGTTWADVTGTAFDQVTSTGGLQQLTVDCDQLRRYAEGYVTVGGTATPLFYCSMELLAQKALV
jgi:hypothetical protein